MTTKEYTKEEQAQLYTLTKYQIAKAKKLCRKYHVHPIDNFHIASVNAYGTQFVNIEELPYIALDNDKSEKVTIEFIGGGEHIKNPHEFEAGSIKYMGIYYKINYIHRQNEDNNFVLQDSHNTCYAFKTLTSLMRVVRSVAFAENIGLVIKSKHNNDMRYFIDGTPEDCLNIS